MADHTLTGEHFVWGTQRYYDDTYLEEVSEHSIVSLAVPRNEEEAFVERFHSAFGTNPPQPGMVNRSQDDRFEFLWMSPDQILAYFITDSRYPEQIIKNELNNLGYVTDQTHNWCQIRLVGNLTLPSLERICPLDLHPDMFPVGSCARTVMEHLNTVIIRKGSQEFLFLSPSSSAVSFLRAIEQSLLNTGNF